MDDVEADADYCPESHSLSSPEDSTDEDEDLADSDEENHDVDDIDVNDELDDDDDCGKVQSSASVLTCGILASVHHIAYCMLGR